MSANIPEFVDGLTKDDITTTYENVDGEWLFVSRIKGLDDCVEYAHTKYRATRLAEDTIHVLKEMRKEHPELLTAEPAQPTKPEI